MRIISTLSSGVPLINITNDKKHLYLNDWHLFETKIKLNLTATKVIKALIKIYKTKT